MAADIRTGSNVLTRLLSQPHRFIEHTGDCNIDVEDSNPAVIEGLMGPVGEAAKHVVMPVP